MKRELLIPEDGAIKCGREGTVELSLGSMNPGSVALELALLREHLADTLTFRAQAHRQGAAVRLRSGAAEGRASVSGLASCRVDVVLSPQELDAWLAFFLRYHRDSVAEVDHVDTEAMDSDRDGESVDVIVSVANAAAPVSSEETRRRLGL